MNVDVIIIGAGITGLTLAYHLRRRGRSVIIIEAGEASGGSLCTVHRDGYLLEYGANSTILTPELGALCADLALTEQIVTTPPTAKNRYLVTERRSRGGNDGLSLAAAPRKLLDAITTPLLSPRAKLRALLEPVIPRRPSDDETVASFISRRFGADVAHRIVAPVLSGVWAGDIERLSARCALHRAWEAERSCGSVLRGFLGQPKDSAPKQSMSFVRGMSTLSDRLAVILSDAIRLRSPVVAIERGSTTMSVTVRPTAGEVERISGTRVVLTCGASIAATLLRPHTPSLADSIARIPCAPIGLLFLTAPIRSVLHPLDGFGFLVPPMFGTALRGALFSSTLFPHRAPEGRHLLTCFVGGATAPDAFDATNEAVQARVIQELQPIIGATSPLDIIGAHRWPSAIPNYPLGHHAIQQTIGELNRSDLGISVVSNWYRGLSVGDRVADALVHAELIDEMTGRSGESSPPPTTTAAIH